MRLGQLARKLQVKPEEITTLLHSEYGVSIENDRNTKIPDDYIANLETAFAKEEQEKSENEDSTTEVGSLSEQDITVPEVESKNEIEPDNSEETKEEEEKTTTEIEEEPETIKAPKVELEGPTIVGKIDLPEPVEKEPEMIEVDGVMVEKKQKRKKKEKNKETKTDANKQENNAHAKEDVVVDREAKKRMEKERKEKEKQERLLKQKEKRLAEWQAKQKKKEKQKRKQHYLEIQQSIKSGPKSQKKKSKTQPELKQEIANNQITEEKTQIQAEEQEPVKVKKGPLGKFWDWLTKG